MTSRFLISLMAGLVLIFLAGEARAQTLFFTAIPDEDETRLQERFDAVAAYLAETLEIEVVFVPVKSYAASVSAFRNNQVQLGWFGGLSGVRAQQMVPGSRAIAQGVDDPNFKTYFIAHHESGIEASEEMPEGLRGATFTFGPRGSTSGRLMPEFFLREHFGESPDSIFRRVGYSGNHTRTAVLVESGAYQAGALNYKVWHHLVDTGEINTDRVSVVWETPGYVDYHWVIRGDVERRFGEGFIERVQQAFFDMDDPELLARFPRDGFIEARNEDYAPILEMARQLDLMD